MLLHPVCVGTVLGEMTSAGIDTPSDPQSPALMFRCSSFVLKSDVSFLAFREYFAEGLILSFWEH